MITDTDQIDKLLYFYFCVQLYFICIKKKQTFTFNIV